VLHTSAVIAVWASLERVSYGGSNSSLKSLYAFDEGMSVSNTVYYLPNEKSNTGFAAVSIRIFSRVNGLYLGRGGFCHLCEISLKKGLKWFAKSPSSFSAPR
jgi:hypothetical protein